MFWGSVLGSKAKSLFVENTKEDHVLIIKHCVLVGEYSEKVPLCFRHYEKIYNLGTLDNNLFNKLNLDILLSIEEDGEFFCPDGKRIKPEIHFLGYYLKTNNFQRKKQKTEQTPPLDIEKDENFQAKLKKLVDKVKIIGDVLGDDLEDF